MREHIKERQKEAQGQEQDKQEILRPGIVLQPYGSGTGPLNDGASRAKSGEILIVVANRPLDEHGYGVAALPKLLRQQRRLLAGPEVRRQAVKIEEYGHRDFCLVRDRFGASATDEDEHLGFITRLVQRLDENVAWPTP